MSLIAFGILTATYVTILSAQRAQEFVLTQSTQGSSLYGIFTSAGFQATLFFIAHILATSIVFIKRRASIKLVLATNGIIFISLFVLSLAYSYEGFLTAYECREILQQYATTHGNYQSETINHCLTVQDNSRALVVFFIWWVYLAFFAICNSVLNILRINAQKNVRAKKIYYGFIVASIVLLILSQIKNYQLVQRHMTIDNQTINYEEPPTQVMHRKLNVINNQNAIQINGKIEDGTVAEVTCGSLVSNPDYSHYAYLKANPETNVDNITSEHVCNPEINNLSLWVSSQEQGASKQKLHERIISFEWVDSERIFIEYFCGDDCRDTKMIEINN